MGTEEVRRERVAAGEGPDSVPAGVAGVVYLITNLLNGKQYVGQTRSTLGHRWAQHLVKSRKSRGALHCAIRKYGAEHFRIELLAVVHGSREDLLRAEVEEISRRGCLVPVGYNLGPGGEGVDFADPVIRAKHLAAIKTSRDPEWHANQFAGAQKRLADPEWRRRNQLAVAKAHSRPEYRAKVAAERREYFSDPRAKEGFLAAIERRSESNWKKNHGAAMLRLHQDPEYIAKRDAGLRKAAEGRMQAAVERDQSYPPEVAAERARKREQRRQRMAARRAAAQGSI